MAGGFTPRRSTQAPMSPAAWVSPVSMAWAWASSAVAIARFSAGSGAALRAGVAGAAWIGAGLPAFSGMSAASRSRAAARSSKRCMAARCCSSSVRAKLPRLWPRSLSCPRS